MPGNEQEPFDSPEPRNNKYTVDDEHIRKKIASLNFQAGAPQTRSESELIVGIDFGTTFTGVAYALSADLTENTQHIEDKVNVIKRWPNQTHGYTEKTPTILAYNKEPPLWGGTVKPRDEKFQVSHFKLGLQPSGNHYRASSVIMPFLDPNYRHPLNRDKRPVDFAADYLKCILEFVKTSHFPREFGQDFLRRQKMSYVITVPAIWKESAKALTREAAERAGIPGRELTLITEPEAAALYCSLKSHEVDLGLGDRFLVCDAGGGTVVSFCSMLSWLDEDLIAYEVTGREPFEVKECNEGSGGLCGASFLNKAFEGLLRRKLGSLADTILNEKELFEANRYFEARIKTDFNPYDSACDDDFRIQFRGHHNDARIGLEEGVLVLSK
jgi:hypothetical protein